MSFISQIGYNTSFVTTINRDFLGENMVLFDTASANPFLTDGSWPSG